MWGWLTSPIDPDRAHDVGLAISWHARSMVLGWGVVAPLAIIAARFFKVMPGQDWPKELDNQSWWHAHRLGQALVVVISVVGLLLVLPSQWEAMRLHNWLGYFVLFGLLAQVLLGVFRGSKGGDHYDMTARRRAFEWSHKLLGYALLSLALGTIGLGFWRVNAPVWMWLTLVLWWACLIAAFVHMQRRGMAVDTYQAIWGDDPHHPGNRRPVSGWGMRRPGDGPH